MFALWSLILQHNTVYFESFSKICRPAFLALYELYLNWLYNREMLLKDVDGMAISHSTDTNLDLQCLFETYEAVANYLSGNM